MKIPLSFDPVHPAWKPCLQQALQKMDPVYLDRLQHNSGWLPGQARIFNAFCLPPQQTQFILFGESPYPRAASANGYAFWDAAAGELWSENGLQKTVNRATSLRNFIKMLLVAEGLLTPDQTTPENIARLSKQQMVQTVSELFQNLLQKGFLLLNTTLVLQSGNVRDDARAWQPFVQDILRHLQVTQPHIKLILLGRVAAALTGMTAGFNTLVAEHPYNLSFISNPAILDFFRPIHALANVTRP